MKLIIAGSRGVTDYRQLEEAVWHSGWTDQITEIVSGGARGADKLGQCYANRYGIPIITFLPDWGQYGKAAGPRRNWEMAQYGDALLALWDGESRGTADMIHAMHKLDKPVWIHPVFGTTSIPQPAPEGGQ